MSAELVEYEDVVVLTTVGDPGVYAGAATALRSMKSAAARKPALHRAMNVPCAAQAKPNGEKRGGMLRITEQGAAVKIGASEDGASTGSGTSTYMIRSAYP